MAETITARAIAVLDELQAEHGVTLHAIRLHVSHPVSAERFMEAARAHPLIRRVQFLPGHIDVEISPAAPPPAARDEPDAAEVSDTPPEPKEVGRRGRGAKA